MQLPWAMRVRLAELLLRCMFEGTDAAERISECEELVKAGSCCAALREPAHPVHTCCTPSWASLVQLAALCPLV